jgi:hypothetical protein
VTIFYLARTRDSDPAMMALIGRSVVLLADLAFRLRPLAVDAVALADLSGIASFRGRCLVVEVLLQVR